ncbi:hypothetical protein GE061_007973 [Apolygus lucorum]|uniref:Uncharacterized protein n=1 Tax=Apolygus lucorum TaxID=248454 RepID=A0A8S9WR02_APOLU|nr:hypothetical protein GE061_007973 [Apolygus lucorum]
MCSGSNEPNFSFVYSYYTDPRVVKAQRVQEEVIANCKHNVELLTNEMTELKTILAAITMKYKVAEDARKVMYKRNSILMDDNAFLQQKLKETELYRAVAEKAADSTEKELRESVETVKRLETALKEIISEGLNQDKKKRRALLVRERATSTTDIPALMEVTPEGSGDNVEEDFGQELAEKPLEDEVEEPEDEPKLVQVKSTKSMQEKAAGDSKKISKILSQETAPERALDRVRHVKLVKVSQELERLKHMNSWKTSELGFKSRELKMKDAELAEAKKEILLLKNKLTQSAITRRRMNAKKWIENAAQKRIAFKPNAAKHPPPKTPKKDEPKG